MAVPATSAFHMGISINFVAARSESRADLAHKLSFGHAEQQFVRRSNHEPVPSLARRLALHVVAIKRSVPLLRSRCCSLEAIALDESGATPCRQPRSLGYKL